MVGQILTGVIKYAMHHKHKEKEYIDANDIKFKLAVLQTLSKDDLNDNEDPSLFWERRKEINRNKY